MSSTIVQAREDLGHRLRDLRKDAGLTGRELATLAGWHSSKVSKIEYGKQTPTEDDIRTWCQHCQVPDQIPDFIATVRNIESMYTEWCRMLRVSIKRRQEASISLEAQTGLFRWYEPVLVPGILHTVEYATAVMAQVIAFDQIPGDDMTGSVATRMERQHILYQAHHRFHFILAQQALLTTVGDTQVMLGQLDRLLTCLSLPRIRLGIIPATAAYQVPTNQFIMFDERLVNVETISTELAITQPREIALYAKTFCQLSKQAVYGQTAKEMIATRLAALREAAIASD